MMFLYFLISFYVVGVFSVPVIDDIKGNGNDHRKYFVSTELERTDPEEFTISKSMDIRFKGTSEHLHPDLRDVFRVQSQQQQIGEFQGHRTSGVNQNVCVESSQQDNTCNTTKHNQNYEELLTKKDFELLLKERENVFLTHSSLFSNLTQNCESLVGTTKSPFCSEHKDTKKNLPKSCKEIQSNGHNISGIFEIHPNISKKSFSVLCDMETMGGGWTHIQRRLDGSQDFYLDWRDYKFGFGNINGEFWMGLENMHIMTSFQPSELLIEITDNDNVKAYAYYDAFTIGSEWEGYALKTVRFKSGDAGDSLTYHLGTKFSTKDYDQDISAKSCAVIRSGAWWYKDCMWSNLNGKFLNRQLPTQYEYQGLHWRTFRSIEYCHAKVRMLIRPV